VENPGRKKEDSRSETSHTDESPSQSTSQLPQRAPPNQIEHRSEQDSSNLKVISSVLEHRILEMESRFSHELGTMQSEIDSGFSGLHGDISDLSDSLNESMDQLEDTVGRFTSTMKWYLVVTGIMAIVAIAFLLWQIFFG
jgi:uncharacterized phage infection (PIP) family protein YhgE